MEEQGRGCRGPGWVGGCRRLEPAGVLQHFLQVLDAAIRSRSLMREEKRGQGRMEVVGGVRGKGAEGRRGGGGGGGRGAAPSRD